MTTTGSRPPAIDLIPTSDLTVQYRSIQAEIDDASGEFERGEELWALERELADVRAP